MSRSSPDDVGNYATYQRAKSREQTVLRLRCDTLNRMPGTGLTNSAVLPLDGLFYFDDFITEAEEKDLVNLIDRHPFCEVSVTCGRPIHWCAGTAFKNCVLAWKHKSSVCTGNSQETSVLG